MLVNKKLVIGELVQKQDKAQRSILRTIDGAGLPRLGLNGIGFNNPMREIEKAQGQPRRINFRPLNVSVGDLLSNGAKQLEALQDELKEVKEYKSILENTIIRLKGEKRELVAASSILGGLADYIEAENIEMKQEVARLNQENNDWVGYSNYSEGMINYIEAENVNMKQEIDRLNQDIDELADLIESDYTIFARMVRPGVALAGGIAGSYMAYQNPAIALEFLKELNSSTITAKLMPYAAELGFVGGAIVGYATSSMLSPVVLYGVMKFLHAIDSTLKSIVQAVSIAIPLAILNIAYELVVGLMKLTCNLTKTVLQTLIGVLTTLCALVNMAYELVVDLIKLTYDLTKAVLQTLIGVLTTLCALVGVIYDYRVPAQMLTIAAILAYYNPDTVKRLIEYVSQYIEPMILGVIDRMEQCCA